MANDEIKITGEPSKNGDRCAFTVDRPVLPGESAFFSDAKLAARYSPLAADLLAIPGVESVLIADNLVTVSPRTRSTGRRSGSATSSAGTSEPGAPIVSPDFFTTLPSEADLKWAIGDLLDREINPAVAQHGGWVELIDVKRNNVYLRLGGGCQGCGAADVTLKQGIEKAIRGLAPVRRRDPRHDRPRRRTKPVLRARASDRAAAPPAPRERSS